MNNTLKIVIVGAAGVGKSTITAELCGKKADSKAFGAAVGFEVETSSFLYEGKTYNCQFWDVAGGEVRRSRQWVRQCVFGAQLIIIACDSLDDSLVVADTWLRRLKRLLTDDCLFYLFFSKMDDKKALPFDRVFDLETIQSLGIHGFSAITKGSIRDEFVSKLLPLLAAKRAEAATGGAAAPPSQQFEHIDLRLPPGDVFVAPKADSATEDPSRKI